MNMGQDRKGWPCAVGRVLRSGGRFFLDFTANDDVSYEHAVVAARP